METKLLKVGTDVYFVNKDGSKPACQKFDGKHKLLVQFDDSTLEVPEEKISEGYGNIISFQYNDTNYIVDDGYRNSLVRSGYFISKDYGVNKSRLTLPVQKCEQINRDLIAELKYVLENDYEVHTFGYKITVNLFSISQLVNCNQRRKHNNLAFYPFESKLDKWMNIYYAVYLEREEVRSARKDALDEADKIIGKLQKYWELKDKGNYVLPMIIKKKVVFLEGEGAMD